jgi:hypothetical protein
METDNLTTAIREPWNKGKLVWEDTFQPQRDLAIRMRLQLTSRFRELPLFGLAIDSKFRSCGLVQPRVREGSLWPIMACRALILQQKTQRPAQFEITEPTRVRWIDPRLFTLSLHY